MKHSNTGLFLSTGATFCNFDIYLVIIVAEEISLVVQFTFHVLGCFFVK